jgi:hypothetical protein
MLQSLEMLIRFCPEGAHHTRCDLSVMGDLRPVGSSPFLAGQVPSGPGYATSIVLEGSVGPAGLSQEFVDLLGNGIRKLTKARLEAELIQQGETSQALANTK